jgi:hypothetical protein
MPRLTQCRPAFATHPIHLLAAHSISHAIEMQISDATRPVVATRFARRTCTNPGAIQEEPVGGKFGRWQNDANYSECDVTDNLFDPADKWVSTSANYAGQAALPGWSSEAEPEGAARSAADSGRAVRQFIIRQRHLGLEYFVALVLCACCWPATREPPAWAPPFGPYRRRISLFR